MKTTNPPARNSPSHYLSLITSRYLATPKVKACSPRRAATEGGSLLTVLLLALCCFALGPAPKAFGVSPPPDGGYPGANTAEGQNALQSLSSGMHNTATGFNTLFFNTTGSFNTATGSQALKTNTTGANNTATGVNVLFSNTTGSDNTAHGFQALNKNTTGVDNTATGSQALRNNTTGDSNTATGFEALFSNTTGNFNTATGFQALKNNTFGEDNTATGESALFHNTTGADNTATGNAALLNNTTGNFNTATGQNALFNNTTGGANTAHGSVALFSNTTGLRNTATGSQALFNNTTGGGNTATGDSALFRNTTGSGNIALGDDAGFNLTTGNHNIDIGSIGNAADSNTIRMGDSNQTRTFIAGIRGRTTGVANAIPVLIDSSGQLGTVSSSRRFKKDIKAMDQTSEAILGLKPVTFQYKSDPAGTAQFGLIAEEVAEVNPDLVVRDENGEIYTVRYDAVNAMLLNEFLKEHRKVEEQEDTIAQLKKDFRATVAQLTARLDEQASQIQKVSARVEVSSLRRAPHLATEN